MDPGWFHQDKPAVLDALRRGERPLPAAAVAAGPIDEMVALHIVSGDFDALDAVPAVRERAGLADALLHRTSAVLPFLVDPAAGRPANVRRRLGMGLARRGPLNWSKHKYVRTIQGRKEAWTIAVASVGELNSWDGFVEAARGYGVADPSLWVTLVREPAPKERPRSIAGRR